LINNLEWFFLMWILCCLEIGWILIFLGVTFLVVPPKDNVAHESQTFKSENHFESWNFEVFWIFGTKVSNKLSPQYIIVNFLKCKYQKWIPILQYLKFWVESYGQMKDHESNSQFDYWALKPRNMDQMTFNQGVQHGIRKILLKIITL